MEVSIIIINYKSCSLVLDCIESIVAQTEKDRYEIIVVDNDSQDGAREQILGKFPDVRWLEMGYNSGFSRANNAGMRIATGEYVLILNADTIILDNAIMKTVDQIRNYPGAIGGGAQLLNTDGSTQISGAHFIRGGLNTLLPLPYLGRLIRYLGYQFKSKIPSVQEVNKDIEVDWVVGAYLIVKRSVLEQTGMFHEDFFMYAEEIEWCARLRKAGKLVLLAEPRIIHIGGGTSSNYYSTEEAENGKNLWNRKGRQVMVSNMLRIRKQFGTGWLILIAATYFFEIPVFAICLILDQLIHLGKSKYRWKNVADYCANMGILMQYLPRMIRNKPYFYKVA